MINANDLGGSFFGSNISVLLANDGQEVWSFVKTILEDSGFRVISTTSGHDGLNYITENKPELVIIGEELGDINGLDWIARVRQTDPHVRVSFVANQWRDAEFYQSLKNEYSISLVVHRPFKPSLFTMQIQSLFGRTESTDTHHLVEQESFGRHEVMKLRYLKVLPARYHELSLAVCRAEEGSGRGQREIEEALRLAHNMKGSARYCGLRQVGELAEHIEKYLTNILNEIESNLSWQNVAGLLSLLKAQVEESSRRSLDAEMSGMHFCAIEEANRTNVLMVSTELIVESLERNLKLLRAESFDEALQTAQHQPIEAALIDLSVQSRQSALQFAHALRELDGNHNLPLGFISSGRCKDDQLEATRAGGSIFLEREADARAICSAAEYLGKIRQGGRPRVLIIDDDPDFCQIVSAILGGNGMLVRVLHERTKLVNELQEFSVDLILLDVMMPMINGFDVCRQLRSMARWQDVPIILLTAYTGAGARINAFEAGADDYLPKPIIEMELLARVRFRLERARLLKERTDKDLLTGLLSRRAFTQHVDALVSESARHQFNFCIGFLDLDHFKSINDIHGHLAGDNVLKYLGELLSRRFRVEDLRARWGGEEFALAFPHATSCVMRAALSRVLEEMREATFEGEHSQFHVTFSAGMATFPSEGRTQKELLQCADRRLYHAKEHGRNKIVVTD